MTTKEEAKNEKLKQAWVNRKMLRLTFKHMARLKKGKRVYVVADHMGYELVPNSLPDVFDAKGNRLGKAALRKLARGIR